ncbi:unnamed protein product [Acidithrix sp. C25]|nr:unnamed protein product [Acidithrix sp. C25]
MFGGRLHGEAHRTQRGAGQSALGDVIGETIDGFASNMERGDTTTVASNLFLTHEQQPIFDPPHPFMVVRLSRLRYRWL